MLDMPTSPPVDDTFTIDPPPCSIMRGATAFMPRNGPTRLTASTSSKVARSVASSEATRRMPALLTSTSS